jgi:hypothetical protein
MRPLAIISGGQTGVDRAALDLAIERGIPCSGWCPRGGWAEDLPEPPGLIRTYPMLRETPLGDPAQRTEWNIRDCEALLILTDAQGADVSRGTALAIRFAERYGKPHLLASLAERDATERVIVWLEAGASQRLAIGGPRESEAPGIYLASKRFLEQVFTRIA